MKLAIIGTGLIGGSLAIALKNNGFVSEVIGVDANPDHAQEALSIGFIDRVEPLEKACVDADLVVLAIPVNAICKVLPKVLDHIGQNTVVADMGSTKAAICKTVDEHPRRSNFVATHPIAGTENTGPSAAIPDLYRNKLTIICEAEKSSDAALDTIKKMYDALSMRIIQMGPDAHDLHIAYVSHLSHISSFTLGLTVLKIEKDEKSIFNMAGSGFASTVRLAKSSPEMWAPIFDQNADNVSKALGAYIDNLIEFKKLIDDHQQEQTKKLMQKANDIRRILNGIELAKV